VPSASGGGAAAPLLLQAVLDPLSRAAQRLAGVLAFARAALDPDVELLLHPELSYADLPLKAFYRYVAPDLGAGGAAAPPPPAAVFAALPPRQTLTLGMDVPEAWLVRPVAAARDLDNLRLEELPPGERWADAAFELEALLVTGSCVDAAALRGGRQEGVHPRGVQLQLGREGATAAAPVDTLVMANLGYFQFKAAPGAWALRLAPGRSRELYALSGSTGAAAAPAAAPQPEPPASPAAGARVLVSSFAGRDMLLVLEKARGREEEDVLDAPAPAAASLWGKLGGALSRAPAPPAAPAPRGADEVIHVFTVASGHMYERLQKIMVLSAVKRASARLKFWFISNYMSPQMRAFVPVMARHYGFEYE
jgi:UDP-glucose:glycoprotein glucosyltransferase